MISVEGIILNPVDYINLHRKMNKYLSFYQEEDIKYGMMKFMGVPIHQSYFIEEGTFVCSDPYVNEILKDMEL